jgi:adenylate cyclase class IV
MSKEEKEIKIDLGIPLDVFLSREQKSGFDKKKEITQRDNYFDTENWDLYKNVAALRIRQVNGVDHSFAFKKVFCIPTRNDGHYVEEIEDRFPLQDKDKLMSVFERLGIKDNDRDISDAVSLEEVFKQNGFQGEQVLLKTRQAFEDSRKNEIVIDDVENVGTVIELECEDDEPMDIVKSLLENDEWTKSTLGTSYIWLEKMKGFTDHLEHKIRFAEKPDWNVLENEREYYSGLI